MASSVYKLSGYFSKYFVFGKIIEKAFKKYSKFIFHKFNIFCSETGIKHLYLVYLRIWTWQKKLNMFQICWVCPTNKIFQNPHLPIIFKAEETRNVQQGFSSFSQM